MLDAGATSQSTFSGLFSLEAQTGRSRVVRLLLFPIGAGIFGFAIYDMLSHAASPAGMTRLMHPGNLIPFLLFGVVVPGMLILAGVIAFFQKPGTYFTGARFSDSGVEIGKLTVPLDCVVPSRDPQHVRPGRVWAGRVKSGKWDSKQSLPYGGLSIIVVLKQDRERTGRYFFKEINFASQSKQDQSVFGSKAFAEINDNNLVSMLDNCFKVLGSRDTFPAEQIVECLGDIASLTSTCPTASAARWTLLLTAKTVGPVGKVAGGLVGVLISAGVDAMRQHELATSLQRGDWFSIDVSTQLVAFIQKHGWELKVG